METPWANSTRITSQFTSNACAIRVKTTCHPATLQPFSLYPATLQPFSFNPAALQPFFFRRRPRLLPVAPEPQVLKSPKGQDALYGNHHRRNRTPVRLHHPVLAARAAIAHSKYSHNPFPAEDWQGHTETHKRSQHTNDLTLAPRGLSQRTPCADFRILIGRSCRKCDNSAPLGIRVKSPISFPLSSGITS